MHSIFLATGLPVEQFRNRYFISPQGQDVFSFPKVQTGSGAHPSYSVGTTGSFYGDKEGGEGNHPPTLFPRLRVSGAVPPLTHTP